MTRENLIHRAAREALENGDASEAEVRAEVESAIACIEQAREEREEDSDTGPSGQPGSPDR